MKTIDCFVETIDCFGLTVKSTKFFKTFSKTAKVKQPVVLKNNLLEF